MKIPLSIDVAATDDRALIETALCLARGLDSGDFKVVDLSDLSADGRRITVKVTRTSDADASHLKARSTVEQTE